MSQPNFLLICTDQQRADHLGCAGNSALQTPNIDRIAAEGVRFSSCYTSSPACMPARATLVTGLTNRASGCRSNGVSLPENVPTVGGLLGAAGYRTHSVGKLHLKPWGAAPGVDVSQVETPEENPERRAHWQSGRIEKSPESYYGFQTQDSTIGHVSYVDGDYKTWLDACDPGAWDLYSKPESVPARDREEGPTSYDLRISPEIHYNRWIADRTIDYVRDRASDQQPFFLWCSFPDPHSPFAAVTKWADYYRKSRIDLPPCTVEVPSGGESTTMAALGIGKRPYSQDAIVECTRMTYAMISHVDEEIGRVLDALDTHELTDNTVIMFMSDHGDQLGEHGTLHKGYFPFDSHARVPLVCRAPGSADGAPRGIVIEEPVSLLDIVPTILDLAGVDQPEEELMNDNYRNAADPLPAPLPGESLAPSLLSGTKPSRRTALVEFDDENQKTYDLLQMRMLVTDDYKLTYYSPTDEILLFDRRNDPYEMTNLAKEDKYKEIVHNLMVRLVREIVRTEPRLPRRFSGA